jgi:hypothetical protein
MEREKKPHFGAYRGGSIEAVFNTPHSADDIEELFTRYPQANVGILTSNCTVVDADCPEAIEYIEEHFPPSPLVAKTTNGRHYFYAPGDIRRVVAKHQGKEAFSIRGPGTCNYVVGAGSIHPSGARYEWIRRDLGLDELPVLTREDIQGLESRFQNGSAFVPEVAASYRPSGNGGGNLLGFDPSQIRVVGDPAKVGSRNNTLASDIGAFVRDGASREDSLQQALDWNAKLEKPLKVREVKKTHNSIWKVHLKNHPEEQAIVAVEMPARAKPKAKAPAKPIAPIPGVLGEFVDWFCDTSPKEVVDKRIAIQSALALGSVILGRRYVTSADNYSALYFIVVGRSGSGKEHCKTTVEGVLEAAELDDLIGGSGYTSPGAIFSELKETKACHLTVIDEFGRYLEATKAQGQSNLEQSMRVLIEIFGRPHGLHRPPSYSRMSDKQAKGIDRFTVKKPSITLLGMTTPGSFYKALEGAEVENGTLGRFLVVENESPLSKYRRDRSRKGPPERVIEWARKMRQGSVLSDASETHDIAPEPMVINISDEAYQVFERFEESILRQRDAVRAFGLENLLVRAHEIAMRISLIISCSLREPTISAKAAQWSCDYSGDCFLKLVESVRIKMCGSKYEGDRQRVLQAIDGAGEKGLTDRELRRHKGVGVLQPRELTIILGDLVSRGEALKVKAPQAGRPRESWVASLR